MKFLKAAALMAVLLLSAILMLGVLSLRVRPVRGGDVPTTTVGGDINCDSKVDISDATTLLQYLFQGGQQPCALAQDNFASKDDLNVLAARVASLEAVNKNVATVATGHYTGDGVVPKTIQTGLSGKLRYLTVQAPSYGVVGATDQRMDFDVSFDGPNFTLRNINLNKTGETNNVWIAITTQE